MTPKQIDYILVAGLIMLFIVGNFFVQYYINREEGECLRSPFVFGAKQLTDSLGYEVFGEARVAVPMGYRAETYHFNSTDAWKSGTEILYGSFP